MRLKDAFIIQVSWPEVVWVSEVLVRKFATDFHFLNEFTLLVISCYLIGGLGRVSEQVEPLLL